MYLRLGDHTALVTQHVLPHVVRLLQLRYPDQLHFRIDPEPENGRIRLHVVEVDVDFFASAQRYLLLLMPACVVTSLQQLANDGNINTSTYRLNSDVNIQIV